MKPNASGEGTHEEKKGGWKRGRTEASQLSRAAESESLSSG